MSPIVAAQISLGTIWEVSGDLLLQNLSIYCPEAALATWHFPGQAEQLWHRMQRKKLSMVGHLVQEKTFSQYFGTMLVPSWDGSVQWWQEKATLEGFGSQDLSLVQNMVCWQLVCVCV